MWRYLFARDMTAARRSRQELLAWDFDRVVVAHGDVIEADAKPRLDHALAWLS
jgi:hypothetical protein